MQVYFSVFIVTKDAIYLHSVFNTSHGDWLSLTVSSTTDAITKLRAVDCATF